MVFVFSIENETISATRIFLNPTLGDYEFFSWFFSRSFRIISNKMSFFFRCTFEEIELDGKAETSYCEQKHNRFIFRSFFAFAHEDASFSFSFFPFFSHYHHHHHLNFLFTSSTSSQRQQRQLVDRSLASRRPPYPTLRSHRRLRAFPLLPLPLLRRRRRKTRRRHRHRPLLPLPPLLRLRRHRLPRRSLLTRRPGSRSAPSHARAFPPTRSSRALPRPPRRWLLHLRRRRWFLRRQRRQKRCR